MEEENKMKHDLGEVLTSGSEHTKVITSSTVNEIDDSFAIKEEEAEQLVEAALFVAGKFMSMDELVLLTDLNQIIIKDILIQLKKKYGNGAIQIVERNNSYKMDVAQRYHYLINRLASGNTEFTKAEQETLAVIAYKQPVKQSVVIKIRGNKSYDHVRKFRQLGLVTSVAVGHTLELSLSEEFYEYFNVHQKAEGGEGSESEE
ncbi:MAG: segregation and condensation protein B [Patescibacteria group bacterium]|jgi:segregation and condensation protein B